MGRTQRHGEAELGFWRGPPFSLDFNLEQKGFGSHSHMQEKQACYQVPGTRFRDPNAFRTSLVSCIGISPGVAFFSTWESWSPVAAEPTSLLRISRVDKDCFPTYEKENPRARFLLVLLGSQANSHGSSPGFSDQPYMSSYKLSYFLQRGLLSSSVKSGQWQGSCSVILSWLKELIHAIYLEWQVAFKNFSE